MKKKTIDFLQRHKKINYFQRCIRRSKDYSFVDEVLDIGKDPLRIRIKQFGNKNPGRLIYIAQTMGCDGFFAELRFILHEIYFAESFGMTPVVLMPNASCYSEEYPVNGTMNPFEYYFKPVSDVSIEDAMLSCAVVEHNYYQRQYIEKVYGMKSGYLPSEDYMMKMAELVRKYVYLNDVVATSVNTGISKLLKDKRTLGVHVRGADFKRHYINHPNMVTIDEYVAVVQEVMRGGIFEQIFLATDDLKAVEIFSRTFGDAVVYYSDVVRTDGDETVMKSSSDRGNHHYKLGLEVIRDMYTLSACDGIIAGLSNVSIFARIVKLSKDEDYFEKRYLNKGIK